ncbi:Kup system potassium uptake protein [Minicystis rosea]|nr:Kup system potassium uptake protein [Minicystis rosea]
MTAAASPSDPSHQHAPAAHDHGSTRALAFAALGVVFGDIGTSPLYALKECVGKEHGVAATPENVLGLLSLIFWALTMVVTVKYLTFIMRADNQGEGGILALLALVPDKLRGRGPRVGFIAAIVVFGAALLYGDGIITPAISVLSAIEGLEVATDSLKPVVVPLTCLILVGLFWVQKRGTAGIGRVFGPIMVVWFTAIAVLGIVYIVKNPAVLVALWPGHAVSFFLHNGKHGFIVLGSVVLAITGGEALYADMGHFGRVPIRLAWYGIVLPALVLNYFGQGALLLADPSAAENPFFALVPKGALTYMLVALAAAATVIASQALISGAYSLTHQAVQLGFLPRVTVKHTSSETEGQIYIPEVNWALAVACIALVLAFRESSKLAAAYGIAVTGTMGITSVVYFVVLRQTWRWPLWKALPLLIFFLAWDLPFFGSNLLKFMEGGWVPMFVGAGLFAMMIVWKRGRAFLAMSFEERSKPIDAFLGSVDQLAKARVPGTAVFLTSSEREVPPVLLHHVHHNKVLHDTVILLTVRMEHVPRVDPGTEFELRALSHGFHRLVIRSGFMQTPNVPALLRAAAVRTGVPIDFEDITYYLGRESFLATDAGNMGRITESLFAFMARNSGSPTAYFGLPAERVVELGMQVDL